MLAKALPLFIVFSLFITTIATKTIAGEPEIEAYGKLPRIRGLSISPDGKHIAYIQRGGDVDYFVVASIDAGFDIVYIGDASRIKARSTSFPTNKYAVLRGSDTVGAIGYRDKWEQSGALAYNLETDKIRLMFERTEGIHPAQTGLGRIVGFSEDGEYAFMPAFASGSTPPKNLYKVKLQTGRGRVHERGRSGTIDWFVGENGRVLAREDYIEKKQEHRVYSKVSDKWKLIYSKKTDVPDISVQAIDADESSLLFIDNNDDYEAVYKMSLHDGEVSGPVFVREEQDIDYLKTDKNGKLVAVVYSGFVKEYDFIDEAENKIMGDINATFPMSNVSYLSRTDDANTVVIKVSGQKGSASYLLYRRQDHALVKVADGYKVNEIAKQKAIKYRARDGLKIPAIMTFPIIAEKPENLPLIVMPHGGPESYDAIGFDWMAQYLAAKGYMVLQPNFRGSTGFGYSFRDAGRGKWGQEMQDDVADGVQALVDGGYVDPERVCIVGGSYGGYSALAGGAFDPEVYRCVISINGVTDLPLMLSSEKFKYGRNHWVVSYWQKVIGDSKTEREKLKNISPVNFADSFVAPVLLIHGKDDTIVPIRQSKRMAKALKKAGKDVEFFQLKGEDHWLSTSAARLETLKAIDGFLEKHNPVQFQQLN